MNWKHMKDRSIAGAAGFEGWNRAIFHIDEAMSWETVRNLKRMPPLLLIIRNICNQGKAPVEVLENIRELDEILKEQPQHMFHIHSDIFQMLWE